jgi:hypothetical protein
MEHKRYDQETRTAIVEAALAQRKAGKPWADALAAAQAAGFRGKLPRLVRFVERGTAPARKPGPKPVGRPRAARAPAPAARATRLYDEATKAAIMRVARDARAAGKTWAETLREAKAAGYRGGMIALVGFVKKGAGTRKKPGRKPGRKPALKVPAMRARGADLADLQTVLDGIVKERIGAAIDRVLAVLRQARDAA